jgi:hypothetical protein
VLQRPNIDIILSYRGGVRSGTYLGGLRAAEETGVGHAMVADFLQTWASTGEGSKDRPVTEGGHTGAVSLVDGRGDDGSAREGLRQRCDGGEWSYGLQPKFDEIEDQWGDYLQGKLTPDVPNVDSLRSQPKSISKSQRLKI